MPDLGALRADLPAFVLGILVAAAGLGSLALAILRRPGRGLLVSFGGFAFLYGLRLAFDTAVVRDVVGPSPRTSDVVSAMVTYWMGLPFILFFSQLGWRRWRPLLTGLAVAWFVYGLAATAIDLLTGRRGLSAGPIPYLVLASMTVGVAANMAPGVPSSRETRLLRGSGFVLLLFVVNENLGAVGVPTARGIEVYGFVAFMAVLGYIAVSRVIGDERRLLALSQELETARRIQASILPQRVPSVAGLQVAVRCESMAAVGGDFYDFAPREGGLGLLVADVSGHGVPAALVASMVKVAFEAQGGLDEPASVLHGMNRVLCRTLDGPFVTAVYADLEPGSGRIRLAGAGHPPALLFRRREARVEELIENGLVMGFDGAESYTSIERQARPGDRLLMFTDGVIEATNPSDEPFGLERLAATLRDGAGLPPGQLADHVLAELRRFRGRAALGFEDDVTLAVAELVPAQGAVPAQA